MYKRLPPTWPPKMTHLSCSVDCPPVDSSSRSSYKVRHLSCRRFFLYSFFFSDERSSHKGSHNGTNSLIDFFLHSGTLSFCSSINIMKAFRLFFPILQITLYSALLPKAAANLRELARQKVREKVPEIVRENPRETLFYSTLLPKAATNLREKVREIVRKTPRRAVRETIFFIVGLVTKTTGYRYAANRACSTRSQHPIGYWYLSHRFSLDFFRGVI